MQKLVDYFTVGINSNTFETIGAEVETQFVNKDGNPISVHTSQQILSNLEENGWFVETRKESMITSLVDKSGNRIFYELGRHNIEVSTSKSTLDKVINVARSCLNQIYCSGEKIGALPYFAPILDGEEDLLVIPDERDATWLELDGRSALAPLARTSSVQFTFSVSLSDAMPYLNKLGERIDVFLADYPQDSVWKKYIAQSSAGYRIDRYGGPLIFKSLDDYCDKLLQNDVVVGTQLVPYYNLKNVDYSLFIRSVWWHFRLKRYGDSLCIEVRPIARREDEQIGEQLNNLLRITNV